MDSRTKRVDRQSPSESDRASAVMPTIAVGATATFVDPGAKREVSEVRQNHMHPRG